MLDQTFSTSANTSSTQGLTFESIMQAAAKLKQIPKPIDREFVFPDGNVHATYKYGDLYVSKFLHEKIKASVHCTSSGEFGITFCATRVIIDPTLPRLPKPIYPIGLRAQFVIDAE